MKVIFEGSYKEILEEIQDFYSRNDGPVESDPVVTTQAEEEYTPPVMDATGRLWDERIDSSNKKLTKDGKWQKRKGVDPDLYKQLTTKGEPAITPPPPTSEVPAPPAPEPELETASLAMIVSAMDELKAIDPVKLETELKSISEDLGIPEYTALFAPNIEQSILDRFYAKLTSL